LISQENYKGIIRLLKKIEDTERDLKDQINTLKQQEQQAHTKHKQKSGEVKALQRNLQQMQTEKEVLDQSYIKLQSTLTDEQNDLLNQKKITSDLENKNRILSNKEKELESKIKSEEEELQRVENKRKALQNSFNALTEQLKTTEKEREELGREVKDLTKNNKLTLKKN